MNLAHYFFVFRGRGDGWHCAPKNKGGCVEGRDVSAGARQRCDGKVHAVSNREYESADQGIQI